MTDLMTSPTVVLRTCGICGETDDAPMHVAGIMTARIIIGTNGEILASADPDPATLPTAPQPVHFTCHALAGCETCTAELDSAYRRY